MGVSKRLFEEYYEKYILNNINEKEGYVYYMMQKEENEYEKFLRKQETNEDGDGDADADKKAETEDLPF